MRNDWLDELGTHFASSFPDTCEWRTIGREAEFPIVDANGNAADVSELFPALMAPGDLEVSREGDKVVQLDGPEYSYSLEVGRGTLEVISAPAQDLAGIRSFHEAAVSRLLAATEPLGLKVLGYGIQPFTPGTTALMTPKARYDELLQSIGDLWLWFTLTASDQVHVAVSRDEIVPMNNLTNLLSCVTVALCGNSPVFEGVSGGMCSAREGRMGEIGAGEGRHGMPLGPVADMRAYMAQVASHPMLLRWEGSERVAEGRDLEAVLGDYGGPGTELGWKQFLLHDHYIWNSGRPRHRQATIELRAAAQQPGNEHMASTALHLGLVCAAPELAAWLAAELGDDAWPVLRRYHHAVIADGLAAPEPFAGFLTGVLDRCEAALDARGRGEGAELAPLRSRVALGLNPAQAALAAFEAGGIAGLVAHTAL